MDDVEFEHKVVEAKAEFQRELYKIHDARVTSSDAQATVLVAASVAIAGFAISAWSRSDIQTGWLIAAQALGGLSILCALNARAVTPVGSKSVPPIRVRALAQALHEAESAVEKARAAQRLPDVQLAILGAWSAMERSSFERKRAKDRAYVSTVAIVTLELACLGIGLYLG
jgi:hypothetical protein